MSNPTAKDVIKQAAWAHGYSVMEATPDILQVTWQRRTLVIAFHDKGSVSAGFTRRPKPHYDGYQVEPLAVPRRDSALKFLRGETS